ncbi:hypothetical protein PM082_021210 [Marasmius tenuissimus]|nr:hypothetical protein PM082_021210 [Marasmius tenuissimus]
MGESMHVPKRLGCTGLQDEERERVPAERVEVTLQARLFPAVCLRSCRRAVSNSQTDHHLLPPPKPLEDCASTFYVGSQT